MNEKGGKKKLNECYRQPPQMLESFAATILD